MARENVVHAIPRLVCKGLLQLLTRARLRVLFCLRVPLRIQGQEDAAAQGVARLSAPSSCVNEAGGVLSRGRFCARVRADETSSDCGRKSSLSLKSVYVRWWTRDCSWGSAATYLQREKLLISDLPSTIASVVASRIDLLGSTEKRFLQAPPQLARKYRSYC